MLFLVTATASFS